MKLYRAIGKALEHLLEDPDRVHQFVFNVGMYGSAVVLCMLGIIMYNLRDYW